MSSLTLNYDLQGPSEAPVLVLGSSLGSDMHIWDEVVASLGEYRVLRYEFPGHGQSPVQRIDTAFTPEMLGQALLDVLDKEGIDRFHLAGLSLGGMMALWMAINHQERVESFAMICSGSALKPASDWTDRAATVREQGTQVLVDNTMQRWFTDSFLEQNPPQLERTRTAMANCADEGYAQCCEVIANMDNRPDLGRVQPPMTVVRAEFDATLSEEQAEELAKAVRSGGNDSVEIAYISDAAHQAAVQQPDQVSAALRRHLERVLNA